MKLLYLTNITFLTHYTFEIYFYQTPYRFLLQLTLSNLALTNKIEGFLKNNYSFSTPPPYPDSYSG